MTERLPDGRTVSDVEMESLKAEAREWMRVMLEEACVPAGDHAERAIDEAIAAIVAVYVRYGTFTGRRLRLTSQGMRERDRVLDDLLDKLYETIGAYATEATDDEEDKAWLLGLLAAPYYGRTARERLERRMRVLKRSVIEEIADAARDHDGEIGTEVDTDAVTGRGGLTGLVTGEVTRLWQRQRRRDNADAAYVHVFRGSSYDCSICDDMVALGWQPVESAELPPFHRSCRCYCVYI